MATATAVFAEDYDPGFGIDMIRLCVLSAEPMTPSQGGLDSDNHIQALNHMVDRLSARFGAQRVLRLTEQDTHIPEFAYAEMPAQSSRAWQREFPDPAHDKVQDSIMPVRPVRMLTRAEPIETIAEVPDGPPARFVWRHVPHDVARCEGPERIAMRWWRDEQGRALTRDYFRVESCEGLRAWLYREGLYGMETPSPRWFLHGLFA